MAEDRLSFERQAQDVFTERLHYWQETLAMAPPEEHEIKGHQAVDELDELWAETGMWRESCLVSGMGVWPEISASETSADEEDIGGVSTSERTLGIQHGKIYQMIAQSEGLAYVGFSDDLQPQLWYMFEVGIEITMPHPVMTDMKRFFAYVEPTTCSIVPTKELENAFGLSEDSFDESSEPDTGAIVDFLSQRSDKFKALMRSTKFRRTSHRKQVETIDNFISNSQTLSGVAEAAVLLEPQYGYVSRPNEQGAIDYEVVGLQGMILKGVCLGLTMLGRERLHVKGIRRDSDLVSKYDGLALSVELAEGSDIPSEGEVGVGSIVHVPMSGQDFEAVFFPRQRQATE